MVIAQGFPIPIKDYYKVYVRSITYNQSLYIEDCLNGVAKQKTDFPFVHHVIDDCSTDGEQKVIKAWIERECDLETAEYYDNDICTITLAKNKSNPNCTLVAYFLKRNIYKDRKKREELYSLWRDVCLYEAICEGDDYWIAADKLKKQFDFLETHKDYYLHATNVRAFYQNTGIYKDFFLDDKQYDDNYNIDDYLVHMPSYILPCGWLIRNDVFAKLPSEYMMGDLPIFLNALSLGKIHFENVNSAFYRILPQSACHFNSLDKQLAFSNSAFECRMQYAKSTSFRIQKLIVRGTVKHLLSLAVVCGDSAYIERYIKIIKEYKAYTKRNVVLMIISKFVFLRHLYRYLYFMHHKL